MKPTLRLTVAATFAALYAAGCGAEQKDAEHAAAPATAARTAGTAASPTPAAPATDAPAPAAAKPPAVALEEGPEVGNRIPAYKNTIKRPGAASVVPQEFDTQAAKKPTVYIVNSTTCPYCTAYIDRMKAVETQYMDKGVDVVHVYPVREQTAEAKVAHHAAKGFKGGLVDDTQAEFAKLLNVTKTPTAILVDASGKIVYRGRLDDNQKPEKVKVRELADAIDQTLAGKDVTTPETEPFG